MYRDCSICTVYSDSDSTAVLIPTFGMFVNGKTRNLIAVVLQCVYLIEQRFRTYCYSRHDPRRRLKLLRGALDALEHCFYRIAATAIATAMSVAVAAAHPNAAGVPAG